MLKNRQTVDSKHIAQGFAYPMFDLIMFQVKSVECYSDTTCSCDTVLSYIRIAINNQCSQIPKQAFKSLDSYQCPWDGTRVQIIIYPTTARYKCISRQFTAVCRTGFLKCVGYSDFECHISLKLTDNRYRSLIFIDYCSLHTPSHHYTPPRYVLFPGTFFVSGLHSQLGYPTTIVQALWRIVIKMFGTVDKPYSLWCDSTFWQICNNQTSDL